MPKILAIDDNSDNLISLKAIIDDAFPGSTVFTALNGPKGIELAIANNPDVILLDIIMPGMDGFEVCRLLKLDEPVSDIPVVFLTALKGDKENRIRALEVGAEGFLSKPIDETELTVQIRAMVIIKAANEQKRDEKERLEKLVEERTKELIQSQAQLKGIFENLQDAYFQTDLSGCFTIVSPSSVKMYGYQSADELIGLPADKLYFDLNERSSMLSVLRSAGSIKDYVLQGRKKDGSAFWVSMNVQLLKGGDGQILGTEGVVRDISERKKTEDELKESEERFRHISSSISDISYSCVNDPDGNSTINWLYGATEKITGYTIDELFAMKCWGKLVTDEDFPIFKSHILGVLPGKSETCQLRLKRKDGSVIWIQATAECIKGPEDNFNFLYGGIVDITKRKQAEELLRESEEKYRLMVDLLPEAVIIHEGGKFVFANPTALKTVGANSFEQLIERPLMDYVHPDFRNVSLSRIKEIYLTGQPSLFSEEKFVTLKDEIINVEVIGIPILYRSKPAIQTIIRDITERKAAEEVLIKYNSRLELAMKAANMSWWEMDMINGHVIFERRKAEMLGYSPEKFKHYTDFMNLVHPEDYEHTMDAMRSHLNGSMDKYEVEYRIKTISGEYKWFYDIGSVTKRDSEGRPLIVSGLVLNISERKESEELLNASNEFSESLLKTIPFGMDIVDEQGNVLFQSENLENVFRKKAIGCKCWELYRDDKKQCIECPLFDGIEIGKTELYETSGVLGGRIFEISHTGMMFKGKKAMLEIFQDITERKQAEEEMRITKNLLEQTFEQSPVPMVLVSMPDMIIRIVNPACLDFLGVADEPSLINTPLLKISPTWQDFDIQNRLGKLEDLPLVRSLMGGKTEGEERCIIRKDGTKRYELVTSFPIFSDRNEIIAGTLIITDITERKQALEELQKSHNMLEKLAAQVPGVIYQYRLYPDGRSAFPFSSPGMFDIYEVTPDEVREDASPVFTRIHPDDYDYIVETITESARNQTIYHSEFRVILPKQGLRWRMSDAKPELLEDGSTLWHGIITDITDRKRSEEALLEREQLFKGLFNASPDAIVLIDPHHPTILWPIVDCNEASCRMNGYSREEMIGKSIDLLNITPEKLEDRITYYSELKQNGIIHMETSHRHKDGHIFPIEISTSIVVIGGHEMVLGIDRDITERKQAETALRKSEDRYRQFISQVSEGVYRFECDQPLDIGLPLEEQVDFIYDHMFIAECNEAFLKIYGINDRRDIIGKGHLYFHGGRYHPINRETLVKFVLNGYHIENAMTEEVTHQGQKAYISHNSLGIIENNQLVRMWGTQIDITQKIRADRIQQVLYSISNATLSFGDLPKLIEFISIELGELLDSNNFFIAFYDEKTNMLSTIYEKDEKDVLNTWSAEKSATGYVVKNQKSLLLREPELKKLIESGEIEIYGTQSKVWLGVPLFADNKAIGAIVVQSYDNPEAYTEKDLLMLEFISHQISISIERKKAEEALNKALIKAQESDRLKSAFLANMSHEIRTPLNSIIGFSELMADPDFDADQQTEFAKIIINSGNSLLSIISDIMDFSKIEAGQVIVRKFPFVLQNLIFSLQNEYSFTARGKGIELRIDPLNPKDDIWIRSDENRLKQVLVNLVGNAIKFTKEGYVEIGIKATGDCIQFRVSDTGIGIPKEYHDEIFERFRQVESSNSRKYGGNGLGLAISKSLVEMMGGEIWIESVQGKGSTFYFTIPIGLTTI